VPVDLNALMFHMEKTLARASKAAATAPKRRSTMPWPTTARRRWRNICGMIKRAGTPIMTSRLIKYVISSPPRPCSRCTSTPLPASAAKVAAAAESQLLKPGGLTTTTVNSGQQWDAPNGWAPLQWVAAQGLQNYGQQKIAMEVSWRFLSNVQHTYDSQQKLVEKYDVSSTGTGGGGGEYPLQDGFGWTNGVTLKMLDLICQEKPCDSLPASRPVENVENPLPPSAPSRPPTMLSPNPLKNRRRKLRTRRAHRRVFCQTLLRSPLRPLFSFLPLRVVRTQIQLSLISSTSSIVIYVNI
jgi:alpha,alpha-trehalase